MANISKLETRAVNPTKSVSFEKCTEGAKCQAELDQILNTNKNEITAEILSNFSHSKEIKNPVPLPKELNVAFNLIEYHGKTFLAYLFKTGIDQGGQYFERNAFKVDDGKRLIKNTDEKNLYDILNFWMPFPGLEGSDPDYSKLKFWFHLPNSNNSDSKLLAFLRVASPDNSKTLLDPRAEPLHDQRTGGSWIPLTREQVYGYRDSSVLVAYSDLILDTKSGNFRKKI